MNATGISHLYSTIHREKRQRNQRENVATVTGGNGKTNAIKEKQRNTAIHLLTRVYIILKIDGCTSFKFQSKESMESS